MKPFAFLIKGLDYGDEVALLKRVVGPLVGGELNLDFDVLNSKMTVRSTGEEIDPEMIRAAVATTGMTTFPGEPGYCHGGGGKRCGH
jgi:Zn2+/Cd2+-exporting ATPase